MDWVPEPGSEPGAVTGSARPASRVSLAELLDRLVGVALCRLALGDVRLDLVLGRASVVLRPGVGLPLLLVHHEPPVRLAPKCPHGIRNKTRGRLTASPRRRTVVSVRAGGQAFT